jgi:dienelactone hydrolase
MGMIRTLVFATTVALGAVEAAAQEPRFFYPAPADGSVATSNDVPYGSDAATTLMMDVHRPAAVSRAPVLIFFNSATGADRRNSFYARWGQTAASKGVVGVVPDLRAGKQAQDFQALVKHLIEKSSDYGIDPDAIAVYAGSGNVFTAFPILEDPAQTSIKAAVIYYGTANIQEFRRDLPVLYVRAGLDRPPVNRDITELASRAIAQNAPVTLLNHPTGHHAFEMVDDDDATREIIERTLDFVKRATAPGYQAAMRRALPEAAAAGDVLMGNYHQAAALYATLVSARPDDPRLRLAYGEALLGDAQFATACAEFEKLKGKGLGPRDLGLPAARACMQKGDADSAIAWLRSIPQRFLPAAVQSDPIFAAVQNRADFRALFQPRQ